MPKTTTPAETDATPEAPPKAAAPSALLALGRPATPEQAGRDLRMTLAHSPVFFMRHHPDNWEVAHVDGKACLLPQITVQRRAAGANGMRSARRGAGPAHQHQFAMDRDRAAGWVYLDQLEPIPADCLPPGMPAGGYVREYPVRAPVTGAEGSAFLDAWTIPLETSPGMPQELRFDRASYNRWRVHLLKTGAIRPPTEAVVQRIRRTAGRHVQRIEGELGLPEPVREAMLARRRPAAEAAATATVPT